MSLFITVFGHPCVFSLTLLQNQMKFLIHWKYMFSYNADA